jgi:3-dehydroquinate dehydratase
VDTEVSVVSRKVKWKDDNAKWVGVRVDMFKADTKANWFSIRAEMLKADAKKARVSGTITSARNNSNGGTMATVILDNDDERAYVLPIWKLRIHTMQLANGTWAPVRKKITGRPE